MGYDQHKDDIITVRSRVYAENMLQKPVKTPLDAATAWIITVIGHCSSQYSLLFANIE